MLVKVIGLCAYYPDYTVAKKNGVRYTELTYFDLIRMVSVDPMYTFLLGMVRRETELILEALTPTDKHEFIRRVKGLKVPYDIGRLPMFDSDGVSGVTAAQWKTFAIVYARPCLHSLLPTNSYKSIVLLCEIVTIVSLPIFTLQDVSELYRLLTEHHHWVYGKWAVTIIFTSRT